MKTSTEFSQRVFTKLPCNPTVQLPGVQPQDFTYLDSYPRSLQSCSQYQGNRLNLDVHQYLSCQNCDTLSSSCATFSGSDMCSDTEVTLLLTQKLRVTIIPLGFPMQINISTPEPYFSSVASCEHSESSLYFSELDFLPSSSYFY